MSTFTDPVRFEAHASKMGGPRGCFVGSITLLGEIVFERTYLTAEGQPDYLLNEGTDIGTTINVVDEVQREFAKELRRVVQP